MTNSGGGQGSSPPHQAGSPQEAASTPEYSERLWVPWHGWALPLIAAAILSAELHLGFPGVRAWLPYVLLIPLTALLIFRVGRTRIQIRDRELWVGQAHLPLRYVGEVEIITAKQKRKALGPNLDPTAFLLHRGWVGPVLRVELTDPDDPTPYWLFSTRRPERLAEALLAGR